MKERYIILKSCIEKFDKGLIGTLTGDPDLGNLFDIQGAAVRVIRCPPSSFDVLKQYAAGLSTG